MDLELIKKDGKVTLSKSLESVCATLKNGTYTLSIKRKVKPRSLNQNALMWMWFACIEQETGTPRNDIHDYYCAKFLHHEITFNNQRATVFGGTSALSTEQFTMFLNWIQADAAAELGITLPLPEDMYYQEFVEQYKNK